MVIHATVRMLYTWGEELNSAAAPPASPACLSDDCGPEMAVTLVPHGATTLRISNMPFYLAP